MFDGTGANSRWLSLCVPQTRTHSSRAVVRRSCINAETRERLRSEDPAEDPEKSTSSICLCLSETRDAALDYRVRLSSNRNLKAPARRSVASFGDIDREPRDGHRARCPGNIAAEAVQCQPPRRCARTDVNAIGLRRAADAKRGAIVCA